MGYRKVPVIHTVTFEGSDYEGLIVRLKGLKIGSMRRLIDLMESEDEKMTVMMTGMIGTIADSIVSWNLEDEQGAELPATAEEMEDLEFAMLFELVSRWLEKMTGPNASLGKDSPSGEKFPGQPVTMEAL